MTAWTSGWLWVPVGAAATLGLVLFAVALFCDRSRGRPRCPSCWYDLSAVPGTTCSECGRSELTHRQLRRTRRHWRWAALGVVLMLPAPSIGVAAHRHQLLYALLPKWKAVEMYRSDDAEVEIMELRDPSAALAFPISRAVVRVRGRKLADITDHNLEVGSKVFGRPGRTGIFEDLNGDHAPELVLIGYSGGAHCCFTVHIYSLGEPPRILADFDAHDSGIRFEPTGPGTADIVLADPTFNYWKTAYVSSPKPEVWLKLTATGIEVDAEHQARPLPPKPELDALAQQQRAACFSGSLPEPAFWGKALDLLYSGHEQEAWDLLSAPWPPNSPEHDAFIHDFKALLGTSEWWPKIRAALYPASPPDASIEHSDAAIRVPRGN